MSNGASACLSCLLVLLAGGPLACARRPAVEIIYTHPPEIALPAAPGAVAVGAFTGRTEADRTWAAAARNALLAAIGPADAKAPYTITGVVGAEHERTPSSEGPHTLTCTVRIAFTVAERSSGATVSTHMLRRDFDPADPAVPQRVSTDPGDVTLRLIEACVTDFVALTRPRRARYSVALAGPDAARLATANRLAVEGEYRLALAGYLDILNVDPADHAALFNAAVMHEKLGDLERAEAFYRKALACRRRPSYAQGLDRVREHQRRP